ncbi:MAG: anaerobic ribonucleoside-triphosphate reductase activating protein [Promethearchaeati archaeon]
MNVGGIVDLSTKDIPGKACMVIFTIGCNFRCDFCHNKHLLMKDAGREYSTKELLALVKNNFLITSVSVTGGEPTLQTDLIEFCKEVKKLEKFVSIDTNGSNPVIIETLIPYIDRIAVDLKSPLIRERYKNITHIDIDPSIIEKTIKIINQNKNVDFEIRTTYVKNLLVQNDIHQIIQYLNKIRFTGTFVLQQYQYSEGVGEEFKDKFQKPEHTLLLDILQQYLDEDLPFKIYIRDEIIGYSEIHEIFSKLL